MVKSTKYKHFLLIFDIVSNRYIICIKVNIVWCYDLTRYFLDYRADICLIFRVFFGKFKTSKRLSEINWPLLPYILWNTVQCAMLYVMRGATIFMSFMATCSFSSFVCVPQCGRAVGIWGGEGQERDRSPLQILADQLTLSQKGGGGKICSPFYY